MSVEETGERRRKWRSTIKTVLSERGSRGVDTVREESVLFISASPTEPSGLGSGLTTCIPSVWGGVW